MSDERCKHELVREQCSDCRDGAGAMRFSGTFDDGSAVATELTINGVDLTGFVAPTDSTHWFEARYAGRCAGCGDWFDEGDPITVSVRFGPGSYVGQCCGGESP